MGQANKLHRKTPYMKNLLFFIIFYCSLCFQGFSQRIFPLPSDDPFWIEYHWQVGTCGIWGEHGYCNNYKCQCTYPIYYKTDTIINGHTYNRLYAKGVDCGGLWWMPPPEIGCPYYFDYSLPEFLFATIRQDTINEVVYINEGTNYDAILYDFKNIHVGQPYPQTYNNYQSQGDTLWVISETMVQVNGENYTKWELGIKRNGTILFPGYVSVIKGIGSTYGILANMRFPFESETGDELKCYSKKDSVIYPYPAYDCDKFVNIKELITLEKVKTYPNPCENHIIIETNLIPSRNDYYKIYSSIGNVVKEGLLTEYSTLVDVSNLANGVYLVQLFQNRPVETIKFIKM